MKEVEKKDIECNEFEKNCESTPEYIEGRQACATGIYSNDNPYPSKTKSNQRYNWYVGYYDELHRGIFEKE